MQQLTKRQEMVLEFIVFFIQDNLYSPSLREIGKHMNIRSTNGVSDHLLALQRKGYLQKREASRSRALILTEKTRKLYFAKWDDFHATD